MPLGGRLPFGPPDSIKLRDRGTVIVSRRYGGHCSLLLLGGYLCMSCMPAAAAPKRGEPVPAFSLPAVAGGSLSDRDVAQARLAVLYFFSTKCPPCLTGLDRLQKLADRLKDKAPLIVAIGKQDLDEVKAFAEKLALSFPVLGGQSTVLSAFDALHVHPTLYVVGPEGRVQDIVRGDDASVPAILTALAEKQYERDEPGGAQAIFAMAQEEGDPKGVARAGIGYSLLKEGKLERAETTFRELAENPDVQVAVKGQEGLAETSFRQGQLEEAVERADAAAKMAPARAMPHLVKGKALYRQGEVQEAEQAIALASADYSLSDFGWQKAEAHYAQGTLHEKAKRSKLALAWYEKAATENPYDAAALSNQGVTLAQLGQPEAAAKVFSDLKKRHPNDRYAASLLRQAQAAIAQKQELERRRYIDKLVKDLIEQYNKQKGTPPPSADDWTSPALALSILGFGRRGGGDLMERAGLEEVLQEELTQQLRMANIKVVERAVLDALLGELKLGSSELSDPDTALKLGRILAARLIATGSVLALDDTAPSVSLRLVDTETTDIVLPMTERQTGNIDPIAVSQSFAAKIGAVIRERYPLKGRIAHVEADTAIINLGKKHSVTPGMVFNVLGEGEAIELNGRVLGYRQTKIGQLEVVSVEDLLSYVKPVGAMGPWSKNQKVILK